MTCDECTELLGDAVELTLTAEDEAAIKEHCSECDACRALSADLFAIRQTAGALERHQPSPHIWNVISRKTTRRSPMWIPLASAAALMLAAGSTGWIYMHSHRTAPADRDVTELAQNAESELQQAEQHYEKAIAALEQLTANKQDALDPHVAQALTQSLQTIDQAIADSRAALKTNPGSGVAQASLLEALRMKMSVLQETVSLINSPS
jgi:tetratricopeptide (TPR) repeat protein